MLQQVVPPVLPAFRRLQLIAIAVAIMWIGAGWFISQQLIHAAQNKRLANLHIYGSNETDYIARAFEQQFNQAEQLAATLSLQENIVSHIAEINKLSVSLHPLDARSRYDKLVANRHAQSLNSYLTRLSSALDIPRIYLLDKHGFCVVSSQ